MGISSQELVEYESKAIHEFACLQWEDVSLCELGCQVDNMNGKGGVAKRVYNKRGVKRHVSIDINGGSGSVCIDLDKQIPDNLHGKFNVLTDYGTGEHVNNQYMLFKNKFLLCQKDAVMIHAVPLIGFCPDHGRYYYTEDIMKELADICNFELLDTRVYSNERVVTQKLVFSIFRKTSDDFPTEDEFNRNNIYDSGATHHTGNYLR
jgi:hypothetical protein